MAHGVVTVAFFDFLSENHDYIVFYSTEWPPYGQNPIFYGVFGGPSRREVHAPEGQNPRKVAFLKKKIEKQKKTQKSSKFELTRFDPRPTDLLGFREVPWGTLARAWYN